MTPTQKTTRDQGAQRSAAGLRAIALRLPGAIRLSILSLFVAGCNQAPSVLRPQGPGAQMIANLWWFMLALAVLVFIAVAFFLFLAITRHSRAGAPADPQRTGRHLITWGGVVVPTIILLTLMFATVFVLRAYAQMRRQADVIIEVVGQQWWWEVHYPDYGFTTANEIHIPVGQTVQLNLTSADVIHSFWVPELQGKMDLNPGETNTTWIQADQPGAYRGFCAEFCGLQHSNMKFLVIAQTPEDFDAWVEAERQPAAAPADDTTLRGQQVFLGGACVYCHTIRGTNATGIIGPDLTHFASRRTLGAGIVENNRGNLAGWIVNPQALKPGNRMPPMYLGASDLQAVIAYLESLR